MTELLASPQDQLVPPAPGNPVFDEGMSDMWDYTVRSRDVLGDIFKGRFQIGRDTQIDGGVYTGTYGGEAIVVDTEKYPKEFNDYLDEAKRRAQDTKGGINRSRVLGAVFDTVSSRMRYSKSGVQNILQEIAESNGKKTPEDFMKVPLNEFMKDGVGVCRHMALATASMLERMKAEGHIRGTVSVERSQRFNPKGEREGHAWVRYTNYAGDVIILDVAQGYIGSLKESEGRGWNYMRPEEQRSRAAHDVGAAVGEVVERSVIADTPSGSRYEHPIDKQLAEVQAKFDALKGMVNEKDSLALWKYAAGIMNKEEANQRGRYHEADNEGRLAGEGLSSMSRSALELKDEYLRLFRELHELRRQK